MCSDSILKTTSTAFWKRPVTAYGIGTPTVGIHPLLHKYAVTTQGKLHPLLLEKQHSKQVGNHIH